METEHILYRHLVTWDRALFQEPSIAPANDWQKKNLKSQCPSLISMYKRVQSNGSKLNDIFNVNKGTIFFALA
jgi:hypothetical protein